MIFHIMPISRYFKCKSSFLFSAFSSCMCLKAPDHEGLWGSIRLIPNSLPQHLNDKLQVSDVLFLKKNFGVLWLRK
jgi:hypothetical protein